VAVFSANDPFSISMADGAEKWAHRLGQEIRLML